MADFRLDPARLSTLKPAQPEAVPDIEGNLHATRDVPSPVAAAGLKAQSESGVPADIAVRNPALLTKAPTLSIETISASPTLKRHASTQMGAAAIRDETELGTLAIGFNSYKTGIMGIGQQVDVGSAVVDQAYYQKLVDADAAAKAGEGEAGLRAKFGLEGYTFAKLPEADRKKRLAVLQMQTEAGVEKSAGKIAVRAGRMAKIPVGADMQAFNKANSFADKLGIAFRNPLDMAASFLPQSLVETSAGLLAAPVLGPAAIGLSSGAAQYQSAFLDSLKEQGVDVTDLNALSAAISDPQKFRAANEYAIGYSGGVGFLDMVSAGIAGKMHVAGRQFSDIATKRTGLSTTTAEKAANAAVEVGVQGSLGAAGEAVGSGKVDPGAMFLEFWGEAVVGSVTEPLAVNASRLGEMRQQAQFEGQVRDWLKRQSDIVAATKLAQANPAMMADIAQGMAEESGAPAKLYVDGADLVDALNQSGMTIQEFMDMVPSARDEINEGFVYQTSIALPVGEVMTNVMKSKVGEALSQKLRVSEKGMSPETAGQFLQSLYNEQITLEAERILSAKDVSDTFKAGTDAVRSRVETELIDSGTTPKDAKHYAELQASFFTVMAKDWGGEETALTLFERQYGKQPMVGRVADGSASLSQGEEDTGADRAGGSGEGKRVIEEALQQQAADGERAGSDDKSGELAQSPVFYSALERGILGNEKLQKGTAEQWLGFISKLPGVKRDEIDAVGLPDFLALQTGAITRDQVLEFVRGNGVQIKDVINASPGAEADRMSALAEKHGLTVGESVMDDSVYFEDEDGEIVEFDDLPDEIKQAAGEVNGEVKYGKYQLPGGKNYRELLLTLPTEKLADEDSAARFYESFVRKGGEPEWSQLSEDRRKEIARDVPASGKSNESSIYRSGHWDAPNVLAHIRFNERTGANGERILHIEEVQSDWHQAGRKDGYASGKPPMRGEVRKQDGAEGSWAVYWEDGTFSGGYESREGAENRLTDVAQKKANPGVPDAPFKETSAWSSLAMKRMLRYAVDNGFEAVTWTGGEAQSERYDISKEVSRLVYMNGTLRGYDHKNKSVIDKQVAEKDLADYIGKDVADRLLSVEPNNIGVRQLDGDGLKVNSAGMVTFYDKMLPQFTNGIIKKMGGKVEEIDAGEKFLGFRINDQMREQVAAGQALFQGEPAGNRGGYIPTTGQLRLYAKADPSTFLHETGHQFLDMTVKFSLYADAPAAVKERADGVLAWLGVEAMPGVSRADTWMSMTLEEQRPMHEKFAETFEQYLFTGKAPSLELAKAFRAFKDFLKAVYNSIKAFVKSHPDASIDPEVTALMDRMLATEQQIAEAGAARSVIPLFSVKPELMTPEGWRKYQEDFTGVKREAAEYIDLRRMRDMKYMRVKGGKVLKDLQKETAEKRRKVRIDAARNILTQPVYKVRQLLEAKADKPARKVKADGLDTSVDSISIAIAKLGGMNRDAAVAEWGIDPADFKDHPFGKPILRAKGGMMPGDVVEALSELGYLPLDENGKPDANQFADLLDWESRGTPQYSYEADWSKIMADDFLPIPDLQNNIFAGARLERYSVDRIFTGDPVAEALPSIAHMMEKDGVNPDELAFMFGYPGGREMIVDILSSRPTNEAIEAETDRLMIERYGDIESPEAMARIVDEAMSSETRLRMLATEYAAMTGLLGSVSDLVRAAKQSAADIVDGLKVGTLRPEKYRFAAARAGKDAATSWNKGKQDAAIVAKRGQVLNEELAKEAAAQKADVKAKIKEIRKWFKKDADLAKSRNMDMVALARSIAGEYGMASESQASRASDAIKRIKQYDPQAAADLDSITAGLPPPKPYAELTVAEFRAVMTVAEAVWNLARYDKKVELGETAHDIETLSATVVSLLGGFKKPITQIRTLTRGDKAARHMLGLRAHWRRVESFFQGTGLDLLLFNPVSNAVAAQKIARGKLTEQYVALLEKIRPDLYTGQIVGKGLQPDGTDFVFTNGMVEVLHAILHTGNESNKRKLLLGRGWADKTDDGGIDTARWDAFVAELVKQGKLKKEHYDFAQGVWDLMDSIKPEAQQAHRKMFGYYFNEVTANPIATPFGVYPGGYVPAIGDRTDPVTGKKIDAAALSHADNASNWPTTGKGFTQERVEYNVALELNLGALVSHLDATTRFIHIEPTIKELAKLFNREDVKSALEGYAPGAMANIVNPWLMRAAQQTVGTPGHREIDAWFRYLNTAAGASMMAANVTNAVQQMTGFTLALASKDVTGPAMLRALVTVGKQPGAAASRAKLLSKWMEARISQQSFEMEGRLNALLLGDSAIDTAEKARQFIQNNAYFMQTMVQNRLDVIVWTAAYDVAEARGHEDPVAIADRAVRDTQGSFAPEDISNIESGNQYWRSVIKFYSYFGTVGNLMITQSMRAIKERTRFGANARLAYIWFGVFGCTNMIAKAIVTGWPDDDDDEDGDGAISAWLGDWLGGGAKWLDFYIGANAEVAGAMVPGGGSVARLAVELTDDNPVNDRLATSPMTSYITRSVMGLVSLASGETTDEDVKAKEIKNLLALIGLTGIPTGQLGKSAGYAIDVAQGKTEPETTLDYALGVARGR